ASASAAGGAKGAKSKKRTVAGTSAVAGTGLDNSHVKLTWNAVPGAAAYRVLRGGGTSGHPGGTTYPNMPLGNWGAALSETHADDASSSVPCTRYSNCTLGALGAFQIPPTATPDP